MSKLNVFDAIREGVDFKVRVTPEQSKKVQEFAFKYGYWQTPPGEHLLCISSYLFFEKNSGRKITWSDDQAYFENYGLPEAFFTEENAEKSEIESIKDAIKDLQNRLDKLSGEVTIEQVKSKGAVLHLEVDSEEDLIIRVLGHGIIGYITEVGECNILNTDSMRDAYSKWVEAGMKFDRSVVKWRGGEYRIGEFFVLERHDINDEIIYDFECCRPFEGCGDENILRYEHNKTPILF